MIINVNKLTDFKSNHTDEAEAAIMKQMCIMFGLKEGELTSGFDPDYDFILNDTKIELKISSKGVHGLMEIGRADGSRSGISASKADVYAFLNPAGFNRAKLRLVKKEEILNYYKNNPEKLIRTKTVGNKIGSTLVEFDIRNFNDLYIASCTCSFKDDQVEFDTDTFIANNYGKCKIKDYIR